MSNTQALPMKLTATSTILLMTAMLLATAQAITPTEQAAFMALANSGVTGKYVSLTTLAGQFKAAATALKSYADELHNNGGDRNTQAFINGHITQFLAATVNNTELEKAYNAAVAAGYEGDINDYARAARASAVADRKTALTQMNQIGLYSVMVKTSQIFAQASTEASRLAAKNGAAHLVNAAYIYFLLPRASCNELSVAMGLFAFSSLMLDGVGIGLAFGVIAIGIGIARDIYC